MGQFDDDWINWEQGVKKQKKSSSQDAILENNVEKLNIEKLKKYWDKHGISYVYADYTNEESMILSYRYNAFISALHDLELLEDELLDKLGFKPEYDPNVRKMSPRRRKRELKQLNELRVVMDAHINYYYAVLEAILDGYVLRNPKWHVFAKHRTITRGELPQVKSSLKGYAHSLLLTGLPGMGKSTLADTILDVIPQIVIHQRYLDDPFPKLQVVWLKTLTPDDANPKEFAENFLEAIDKLLPGIDAVKTYGSKAGRTRPQMYKGVHAFSKEYNLGLLVVDEIQRLQKIRENDLKKLFDYFFVDFMQKGQAPLWLIGTSDIRQKLERNDHFIRRVEGEVNSRWNPMPNIRDENWKHLMNTLSKYQYLSEPIEITDDISQAIHDCSQGITSFAVRIYYLAQRFVIDRALQDKTKKEIIDKNVIYSVTRIYMASLMKIELSKPSRTKDKEIKILTKKVESLEKLVDFLTKNQDDEVSIPSNNETTGPEKPPSPTLYDAGDLRRVRSKESGTDAYKDLTAHGYIADDMFERTGGLLFTAAVNGPESDE